MPNAGLARKMKNAGRNAMLENVHKYLPKKLNLKQVQQVLKIRGYKPVLGKADTYERRSKKGGSYIVVISGSKDNPNLVVRHNMHPDERRPRGSTFTPQIQEINQIMRRMRNLARKPPKKA